jgi:hypothetical protein
MGADSLRGRQFLLSTTMLVAALSGYGRRAYGACVAGTPPNFVCSDANATQQTIAFANATVSTVPGFSVVTADLRAVSITGHGAISYTDVNASSLTAGDTALDIRSNGNIAGGNPGSVTVNTNGALTGGRNGIYARNAGSGALSVTANGDVTGIANNGAGISALNLGTDLDVTTGPGTDVTGGLFGIRARNVGTGALSVTANGDVTAVSAAIFAQNSGNGTDLTVTTGSGTKVIGGSVGIFASNIFTGATTVIANGDVTGTSATGIYARNAGTDLSVTTGPGTSVEGGYFGIRARNAGTGSLSVAVNGDVTGTTDTGVWVLNYYGAAGVTTASGTTVTGGKTGIDVHSFGSGGTTITADGDVMGGSRGISALNDGTGALTVTANGDVTATNAVSFGLYARNHGTDLTVTTGPGSYVGGGVTGIRAINNGSAALSVTANGDATGTFVSGIFALNGANGTDVTVTTGLGTTTFGGRYGIYAENEGSGALSVTANGDATGAIGDGIVALNSANGTGLTVTTGPGTTVTGGLNGIRTINYGSGALTVAADGDVTGRGYGIFAYNSASGTSLGVTTGFGTATAGGYDGIRALNYGRGAFSVIANGDVTGTTRRGIFAENYGTDLSVTTRAGTTVTGGTQGIIARNLGTGPLTVTANGDVTGTDLVGIFAMNFPASTGGVNVTTAAGTSVSGGTIGISALNYGTGALTVTANGDVTGTNNVGLYARNNAASDGDLTVTTGPGADVSSDAHGIFTRNFGNAALSVTANGDVTGANITGIHAENYGTDLRVATGVGSTVAGGQRGIRALNYGTGALSVIANGDVTGINLEGIYAWQDTTGTSLDVTTGAGTTVTGASSGIAALNYGTGATSVTANGDVSGPGAAGVYVRNSAAGTDLTVTTGAGSTVSGGLAGIRALNYGTGATRVDADGDASSNWYGVYATNKSTATDLTVTTGAGSLSSGGVHGIRALNEGTGALSVTADGDVTGTDDAGVYARHANGGPIDVTVGAGATAQGGASGVHIAAGAQNSLTNYGTVRNLDGITGVAIVGGTGSETVDNFGLVTGDVLLGTGINAFNNMQGGLFESGADVAIGAGNTLTNAGLLAPGGIGSVFTTALTGNFVQGSSGQFLVDIQGASADRVDATGSASVNGKVIPNYTLASLGSNTQWTVLTATTPIVDNGIKAVSTPVVTFGVDFPTATQMVLVLEGVDFAVSGLNRNERAIADNLTAIFNTGNFAKMDSALNAIAFLPTTRAVANALAQLSPEVYLDTEIGTLYSALSFSNSLMTCPVYAGANAFIQEGQCVWARASGRSFDQDTTFETLGINETSFEVAGGAQGAFADVWRLGFAGAFEQGNLDTSTLAQSDFDRAHAGAVLKYNPGPLLLGGAVSGGWGWYDTVRPIAFPGFSSLASSEHEINYLNGRFRAAYLLTNGHWYAKPMADFDATRISLDHLSERARGGVGLDVRGNDETVLSATPALELGLQFGSEGGTLFRPYIRGGATFFDDPNFVLLASFEGAPSGVGPFRIGTETDDVVAVIAAGIDVVGVSGASFRLYYDGRFGETVEANEGGIKASLTF